LQLHISISPKNVKLNIDCQEVAEKEIKAANNISTDGYEVLGKMAKSGGSKKQSATVRLLIPFRYSQRSKHALKY